MLLELAALPCEACLFGFLLFDWFTVLGTLETWYSCCKGVLGSPGCQVAKVGFFPQNAAYFKSWVVAVSNTDLENH